MTFPSSGTTAFTQTVFNTTAALAAVNVLSITNPVSNQYAIPNATQPPSGSLAVELYGASQGNDTNQCGRPGDAIPQVMVQLQNQILAQTQYVYRM